MTSGKLPFSETPASDQENADAPFSPAPDEAAYRIAPNAGRRRLTPRDVETNDRVKTLFDRVQPGLPIDADPPETRRDAEPFSLIIERTLKRLHIEESPWLDERCAAWPKLVPSEVAKVARPGKWDNGILFVYVTSSLKLFELRRTQQKRIEQAVRAFAGDNRVRQVRLMVNAVPLPFKES